MRWSDTHREASFFGANYTTPFAHAYRALGYLGVDRKYKRQNKMFHFHKTFCSKFSFINTKQNVHFIPFEYALNEIKASNTANS